MPVFNGCFATFPHNYDGPLNAVYTRNNTIESSPGFPAAHTLERQHPRKNHADLASCCLDELKAVPFRAIINENNTLQSM
jgi:hypothetical protein